MLKIITILVLLYSLQQTYQLEPRKNVLASELNENGELTSKILAKGIAKPCARRNFKSNPFDNPDEWVPTFSTRVVKPSVDVKNINLNVQRNDNNPIKISAPEDTILVQKKTRTENFSNPQSNLKQSENLLLNNQDGHPGTNNRQESEAENKPIIIKKELLVDDPETIDYRKSNRNLLVSEEISADRDVLVDNDYLSRPIHESDDQLPQLSKSDYANNIDDEPTNIQTVVDSKHERGENFDKENENCLPEANESESDFLTGNHRRFLSDDKEVTSNDENLSSDNNGLRRYGDLNENALNDPAKGVGIRELSVSKMTLLEHSRVCYACSTVNNPTCWMPDRRTTVKYCRKGHEACVTKTFWSSRNTWILTRDCGKSCDDTDIPGPRYKSCSVCHADMCNDTPNGASTVNKENFIVCMLIIFVTKFTF